jgi:sugar (pentulose or hexulose) kinase
MLDCGTRDEALTVLAGNPFFGPEGWASSPPPTVIGLRNTCTGHDVYQACLLGTCLAIRATLGCLLRQSGSIAPFIAATGGMSRSPSWAQLLADVTGTTVRVRPLDRISGRAGAVVVTGETLPGRQADEEETRVHEPNADAARVHDTGLARYQQLYRTAQIRTRRGSERGMGRRAGPRKRAGGQVSCAGPR